MPERESDESGDSLVGEFIQNLEPLAREIVSQLESEATDKGNPEDVQLINGFGPLFIEMMSQTAQLMAGAVRAADGPRVKAAEEMFQVMGSRTMIAQARSMSHNLSTFGAQFGLVQIMELIKKLIRWVLSVLGINKEWLDKLIEIIDETIEALLAGGDAGARHTFSVREQDYLGELTALANYEAAGIRLRRMRGSDDDF